MLIYFITSIKLLSKIIDEIKINFEKSTTASFMNNLTYIIYKKDIELNNIDRRRSADGRLIILINNKPRKMKQINR